MMSRLLPILFLCLIAALPCRVQGAIIEQQFQINSIGTFTEFSHTFAPFDSALGELQQVSMWANTTSAVLLDQFDCPFDPIYLCDILTFSTTLLALEFGAGCCVDTAGHRVLPGVDSGWWLGANTSTYATVDPGFSGLFDIEDFYHKPVVYRGEALWYCSSCTALTDPLLINHVGSATLIFEYQPASVPSVATLTLFLSGLALLRLRARRRNEPPSRPHVTLARDAR